LRYEYHDIQHVLDVTLAMRGCSTATSATRRNPNR
jgi:hypothetical protein